MLTAVIAYKKDSEQRERNLFFLKKNLKKDKISYILAEQKFHEGSDLIEKNDNGIILHSQKPFQKSKLYNLASKHVHTKYILFLDVDVLLDFKRIISNLVDQDLIRPFSKILNLNEKETELFVKDQNITPTSFLPDDYFSKYSILIKKSIFESCGGFDERIMGWGWEDLDLVHNKLRGIKPFLMRDCIGYHLWHPVQKKLFERKNYFLYKENATYRKDLSFCISIKNRRFQLQKTLLKNLTDNLSNSDNIEFILLDFNSHDRVSEWVISNFKNFLETGYLKLFKIFNFPFWNASIAKNTTHYLGEGKVLTNLDCDNFTGKNGGSAVFNIFEQNKDIYCIHQWCRQEWFSGNYGRISFRREIFEKMGGYNESFQGMGYQDTDILNRTNKLYPDSIFNFPNLDYNKAIANDKNLSIENLKPEEKKKGFFNINSENELLSKKNIKENNLICNAGIFGQRHDIMYFDMSKQNFHPLYT